MATESIRSLLFVPASDPRKIAKARSVGADAIILDLEDSVTPSELPRARAAVVEALEDPALPAVFVRVNHPSTGEMEADLQAACTGRLHGIILPKVESAAEVHLLDALVTELLDDSGPAQQIALLPLVESCLGLRRCYDIATSSPRVVGLAFSGGESGDFMADLDGEWTPDGLAMAYPQSKLVCETRAAGHTWPVDGVCMILDDDAVLDEACRRARVMGYQAKMAIHPRQVEVINRTFTPPADVVAYAEDLIDAFRQAGVDGHGALRFRGVMVDKANVVRAERVLARAARLGDAHGDGHGRGSAG